MMKWNVLISALGGAALGAGVAALSPAADFWAGWLGAGLLSTISLFCLVLAWQWAGGGRKLAVMIVLALLVRLGCGMALSLALPVYGYDNPHQRAGYPFKDSFNRDQAAWQLAKSDAPLWSVFDEEVTSDQYGGLLALSAAVYRFLSPDAHRPFLILILAAFASALAVPFFWSAIRTRWAEGLADLAIWIYIFYPDGIFFSSSQMREPFLMGSIAIAFWAMLRLCERATRRVWLAGLLSLGGMALVSWRVALPVFIILFIWFWLENPAVSGTRLKTLPKWALLLVILGVLAGAAVATWGWFSASAQWDMAITERGSGRMQFEIDNLGRQWRVPFMTFYGMLQVSLPAAIAEPGESLWQGIAIARGAGWYALAPFLLYSLVIVWKVKPARERWIFLFLIAVVLVWTIISSARAGGDQWDNPRYRTIFLPWMALLAGWVMRWGFQKRDVWLARLLAVEGIFLLVFTHWYLNRYGQLLIMERKLFWENVQMVIYFSILLLAGSLLWDAGRRMVARFSARKSK